MLKSVFAHLTQNIITTRRRDTRSSYNFLKFHLPSSTLCLQGLQSRQVSRLVFTGGYHDTLTVHNLNAQSEYYTTQPAPDPSLVCRYGAFTYGRIGTHDKSMFGLPLCQMPGERKMERKTMR